MSIEDDIELLGRVPSLSVLGDEALRVLAIGSESRTLEGGEVLFHEGEPADSAYVVEEGLLSGAPRGRAQKPVLMGRGTLIGELSLLTETRRPATITASEPSSVMRIPRPLFLKMLDGYPDVAERLRQALLKRTENLANELGSVRQVLDVSPPAPAAEPSKPDKPAS